MRINYTVACKTAQVLARNGEQVQRREAERREIKSAGGRYITHKPIAALLIVSHVRRGGGEGGREKKRERDEDFDSHYRYVSANRTIRASADWNFNGGPIISDAEKRVRPITVEKGG